MIEAIGIYIGNGSIYITGLTNDSGMSYLSYYKILNFGHVKYVIDILNEWYKNNLDIVANVPISINLPSRPILRVVEFSEDSSYHKNKVIGWEIDNFLLNGDDYTHCCDINGDSAVIAFAEKDEILDFLNGLNFSVVTLENSVSGLINILETSHGLSDNVAIHVEGTSATIVTVVDGKLKDYKIIVKSENILEDINNYIYEIEEHYPLDSMKIYISGTTEAVDELVANISSDSIEKLNPYIAIGQMDNIITSSNISVEGTMLPISLGFSVNCLSEGQHVEN